MPDRTNCPHRHENGNCLRVGGFCTAVSDEHCEQVKRKNDKDKVDKVLNDIVYLDWYFNEDNGGADKEAVAAYDNLRATIFQLMIAEKTLQKEDIEPKISREEDGYTWYYCGKCGYEIDPSYESYCPTCGAKIKENINENL